VQSAIRRRKSYDEVMPFMGKAERWCPQCEETFVASILHERVGRELGPPQETPCPACGRQGMMMAEVPPEARGPAAR
jgi:ribosomal protein S27AE